MRRIVIKISGSVFSLEDGARTLPPLIRLLKGTCRKGVQTIVVAGGGITARQYINVARSLGGDEASLDSIGIDAARLNAKLLVAGLGDLAYPTVPKDLDEAAEAVVGGKIVVLGGLHPGHSTNAVAALVAERVNADLFVNASDVDGVYTADPKVYKDAKLLSEVTVAELSRILSGGDMQAGSYELMDLVALRIIARSRIRTLIVKCDVRVLRDAISGRNVGTVLLPAAQRPTSSRT